MQSSKLHAHDFYNPVQMRLVVDVCSYVSSSPGCKIYLSGCVWSYLNTHIFFAAWCRFAFESMRKMPKPRCTKATSCPYCSLMKFEQWTTPSNYFWESVRRNNDNNRSFKKTRIDQENEENSPKKLPIITVVAPQVDLTMVVPPFPLLKNILAIRIHKKNSEIFIVKIWSQLL